MIGQTATVTALHPAPSISRIQHAFFLHFVQRYEIVLPNSFLTWNMGEMDICGVRKSGYVDEVEIKLSRADFLADYRKTVEVETEETYVRCTLNRYDAIDKHTAVVAGQTHANYYSFLMAESLALKCVGDMAEQYGVYTYYIADQGCVQIKTMRTPKRLHARKISDTLKYKIARKGVYRMWELMC